jgi:hypothetical protein
MRKETWRVPVARVGVSVHAVVGIELDRARFDGMLARPLVLRDVHRGDTAVLPTWGAGMSTLRIGSAGAIGVVVSTGVVVWSAIVVLP